MRGRARAVRIGRRWSARELARGAGLARATCRLALPSRVMSREGGQHSRGNLRHDEGTGSVGPANGIKGLGGGRRGGEEHGRDASDWQVLLPSTHSRQSHASMRWFNQSSSRSDSSSRARPRPPAVPLRIPLARLSPPLSDGNAPTASAPGTLLSTPDDWRSVASQRRGGKREGERDPPRRGSPHCTMPISSAAVSNVSPPGSSSKPTSL